MDPQMAIYMHHFTGTTDNLSDWNDYLEVDNCSKEQASSDHSTINGITISGDASGQLLLFTTATLTE